MARRYSRDNRGRFASGGGGATARGGRLATAGGGNRPSQTARMQAAGRSGVIKGKADRKAQPAPAKAASSGKPAPKRVKAPSQAGTVRQARNEKELVRRIERNTPGMKLDFYADKRSNVATVSRIVVPKGERGQGAGSRAMRAISNLADRKGRKVALSPSSDFGGNKKRLTEFYGRFGFKKNKDYSISETMVREPKAPRPSRRRK